MRSPASSHVRKLVSQPRRYHPNSAVPEDWNKDGSAYELLRVFFKVKQRWATETHSVQGEKAAALATELRKVIAEDLARYKRCDLRIFDISDAWPGINNVDAIALDLRQMAQRSAVAAIVLVGADYLPTIKGSPHIQAIGRKLKETEKSLVFIDQLGRTFLAGARLPKRIPSTMSSLARLAPAPTREQFRSRVIHHSERWYGHFRLPSGAHVRTHYDCFYHVLRNDWLFRYVRREAATFLTKAAPDMLIGFGLADYTVQHLSNEMGEHMGVKSVFKTPGSREFLSEISSGARIVLVTDIVLTGKSAQGLCAEIERIGAKVVGVLTILALSNSVVAVGPDTPVFPLCQLKRVFYDAPENCPLCRCHYPPTDVTSLEGFRQRRDKVHPYDFWETVQQTRAFSPEHRDVDGKHYTYYIDIHAICSLYADPIARQILHQLEKVTDVSMARLIVYPDSPAAALLAEAISRVLHIPAQPVARDLLAPLSISQPFILPPGLETLRDKPVLVADDGCNTLRTLAALDNLLTRARATPIGYLIALNRANKELTERRETESKGRFQYYYHWPVAVYRSGSDCPECASTAYS